MSALKGKQRKIHFTNVSLQCVTCISVCVSVHRRFAVCNLHFKRQICRIHTYSTNIYIHTLTYTNTYVHTHTHTHIRRHKKTEVLLVPLWNGESSEAHVNLLLSVPKSHPTHTHIRTPTHTYVHTCINACFTKSYIPLEEQALLCSPGA